MNWDDLIHAEKYLGGEILCIHHRIVFPELQINGDESDFLWAKRPTMALVAKGPVKKFAFDADARTFAVKWTFLNYINPDFSIGAELRDEQQTGVPDGVILPAHPCGPRLSEHEVLYLGTDDEVTDVYLLPRNYNFNPENNFVREI